MPLQLLLPPSAEPSWAAPGTHLATVESNWKFPWPQVGANPRSARQVRTRGASWTERDLVCGPGRCAGDLHLKRLHQGRDLLCRQNTLESWVVAANKAKSEQSASFTRIICSALGKFHSPDKASGLQGSKLTDVHRDAEAHKQRRKLFSRGFSQTSMLDFEPHISSKIETTLNQWAARAPNGPIDVYPWCHWLGFDVICR